MELNLDFGDLPENSNGPLPDGPTVMKIVEVTQLPAKSADKHPSLQITLSPNVPPSSPLEGKKIMTWLSFSPKDYPRQLMKAFFEAVYQVPVATLNIRTEDMAGRTVVAVLDHEEKKYTPKRGPNAGKEVVGIFNNVKSFLPDVAAPTTAGIKLQ